jgi:lactate dehydrogenase-like 2-hydroxyacid dehydrogenase
VQESALIEALNAGTIAGAGLDVYEREPLVPQALLDAPNATLLPHLGTATDEVRTAMALRALDNLVAVVEGRQPRDQVN